MKDIFTNLFRSIILLMGSRHMVWRSNINPEKKYFPSLGKAGRRCNLSGWFALVLALFPALIFPHVVHGSEGESVEELIFKANQAYKEERFQDAVDGYRELIQNGYENGYLYYNLGNCHLRLNQLGKAILNYRRAHLLIPRDADLNFNLRYALDKTLDDVPENRSFITQAIFWLDDVNLTELFYGFAVVNILFWTMLFIRLFLKTEWTYYTFLVLLFLAVLVSVSFGLKWRQLKTDRRAVILTEEANVLAGPDVKDTILFKLHDGALVDLERNEDGWALIELSDRQRGWVQAGDVERIVGE